MSGHSSRDIALLLDALTEAEEELAKANIEQAHANQKWVQAQNAIERTKNRITEALEQRGIR